MKKLVLVLTLALALLGATPASAGFVHPMLPCDPGYDGEGC